MAEGPLVMTDIAKKPITLAQFQQSLKELGLNKAQIAQVTNYVNNFLGGKKFTIGPDETVRRAIQEIMANWPRGNRGMLRYGAITKLPTGLLPSVLKGIVKPIELASEKPKPAPLIPKKTGAVTYNLIIPGLLQKRYVITTNRPIDNQEDLVKPGVIADIKDSNGKAFPSSAAKSEVMAQIEEALALSRKNPGDENRKIKFTERKL